MATDVVASNYFFEDLRIGLAAEFSKTITEADIEIYASVSGDTNPIHLNADYAAGTIFKDRIAHGMLTASFISAVFGTRLPGHGAIYVSQSLKFRAPVKIGDTVCARVEVVELIPKKKFAVFYTTCAVGDTMVLDGQATLWVPSR